MATWIQYQGSEGKKLESKISLTKGGYISFSTRFFDENQLAQQQYVSLYYSPEERRIGLKFESEGAKRKGSLKLHANKGNKGGSVIAKGFFKQNNLNYIDGPILGRYDPAKENIPEIGELFTIKLKENDTVVISPPAG